MKKIGTTLASIVLVFGLGACTGGNEPQPAQPTVTVTEEAVPTPSETPSEFGSEREDVFLSVVRENQPLLDSVPDAELVDLAKNACAMFDDGATIQDVFAVIINNTDNPDLQQAIAFVVGAGVPTFCPQHSEKVPGGQGT